MEAESGGSGLSPEEANEAQAPRHFWINHSMGPRPEEISANLWPTKKLTYTHIHICSTSTNLARLILWHYDDPMINETDHIQDMLKTFATHAQYMPKTCQKHAQHEAGRGEPPDECYTT